jgi:hypothetical protein
MLQSRRSKNRREATEMDYRYFLLFSAVSVAAAQTPPAPAISAPQAPVAQAASAPPQVVIKFEDASDQAGIDFTHSFGSRQLGSLIEGTGAGCVWFDYNNSGLESLYVVNGRPLDDSMHPYPLKEKPATPPHNHLYRNDGNGRFTDVTEKAGLNPDMYGMAVTVADYDNDGYEDLLVTGYGKTILYHNDGNGHFTDVTAKAGIKVDGWAISSTWLDYDKDGCVDLFVGRYVKFDPKYRAFYAPTNYPGPLDYEGETNQLFHNNCDGTFTDVTDKSGIGAYVGRTMGVTAPTIARRTFSSTTSTMEPLKRSATIRAQPSGRMANPLRRWARCSPISRAGECSTCGSPMGTTTGFCVIPTSSALKTWARPTAFRRRMRNM